MEFYRTSHECYDKYCMTKKVIIVREKLRGALALYAYFFRIGWFTFGGGWSIVAQMQTDFVEREHKIDSQELLDIVSVGRSLPGTMIGNVAYLFGYHQGGVLSGVMAVLGIITPPLIILSALTVFYHNVRDNIWVAKALTGVRAVVAPVIFSAVLKLQKTDVPFSRVIFYALCLTGCVLSYVFHISCVLIVLVGVGLGLLLNFHRKGAA